MKNKILLPILAAAIPLIGAGCGTNAHYVQTGGSQSVVTIGQINIQDYIQAGNTMTGELLASGALDRVATPPAVLAISRIVNNTGQQIDTDLLTKRIRVALLKAARPRPRRLLVWVAKPKIRWRKVSSRKMISSPIKPCARRTSPCPAKLFNWP